MRKRMLYLSLGITLTGISGCGYIANQYIVDPVTNRKPVTASYYINDGKTIDLTNQEFKSRIGNVDTPEKRNEILDEIKTLSDNECEIHKAFIVSNSNTWNVGTGTLTNIFSGLGTFVGGEQAKSVLAAGAALSNSTRSLVNEEVYVKALATSILSAINKKRTSIANSIKSNKELPLDKFSVWAGIDQLEMYHHSCSFSNAITELSGALGNRKDSKFEIKSKISALELEIERNKKIQSGYDAKALMSEMESLQKQYISASE